MKHRLFAFSALVLALSLFLALPRAFASVELVYFRATAQPNNTVLVTWESATERDTTGYRLYRSQSATPADWGNPIGEYPAEGNSVSGAVYQHPDTSVVVGVKYYYLLRELSSGSSADFGPIPAGVGIATDTPTPTVTASATTGAAATATPTRTPGVGTVFPTATQPAPTATRRFTETPVVGAPTPATTVAGGGTVAPLRTPTRTALPPASVATPTGLAPRVTLPPPVLPTATLAAAAPTLAPTPTFEVVTLQPTSEPETATPEPTKDVTPVIFAAETRTGPATPQTNEDVAGQGSRNVSLPLIIGGSAIGLAGLLAALWLFLRSRRS